MKLFKYKEYKNNININNKYNSDISSNNTNSNNTYKLLMLSLFSVVICASLLCLTSYAWFTSTAATSASSVKAATYNLSYKIDGGTETIISKDGTTTGEIGSDSVRITLTASNTSASTGYCVIKVGDKTYYTDQITAGSSYSFTLSDVNNKKITFTSYWGRINTAVVGTAEKKENNPESTATSLNSFEENAIAAASVFENDTLIEEASDTEKESTTVTSSGNNSDGDGTDTPIEDNNPDESTGNINSGVSIGDATNIDTDTSGDPVDTDSQEEMTNIESIEESEQSDELDVSMDTSGNVE